MTALSPARRASIRTAADALLACYRSRAIDFTVLIHICRDMGIELFDADLRDITGALRRTGERWRIYLNREDAPTRRLFTLAHTLGHYVLHTDRRESFVEGGFTQAQATDADERFEESEANVFAACLVMPAGAIHALLADERPTEQQVLDLAERFRVSPLAVAHCLEDLGYPVPSPQSRLQPASRGLISPAGAFTSSARTGVR